MCELVSRMSKSAIYKPKYHSFSIESLVSNDNLIDSKNKCQDDSTSNRSSTSPLDNLKSSFHLNNHLNQVNCEECSQLLNYRNHLNQTHSTNSIHNQQSHLGNLHLNQLLNYQNEMEYNKQINNERWNSNDDSFLIKYKKNQIRGHCTSILNSQHHHHDNYLIYNQFDNASMTKHHQFVSSYFIDIQGKLVPTLTTSINDKLTSYGKLTQN